MPKGKKSKSQKPRKSDEREKDRPPSDISPAKERPQQCSFCRSLRNRTKASDKCWLCGGTEFLDLTELEFERREKPLRRRESCCVNPNCARALQLVSNAETFCGSCGATLEKSSLEVWLKFVGPEIRKHRQLSPATRERLLDLAFQSGVSREVAAAELYENNGRDWWDTENQVAEPDRPPEVNGATETTVQTLAELNPENYTPPTANVSQSARLTMAQAHREHLKEKAEHLRTKLKFGIVLGSMLIAAFAFVLVRRGGQTAHVISPSATPSPTPGKFGDMVLVPGGTFTMGCDVQDGGDEFESPAHQVTVKPFYIDIHEVTREQYKVCVDAGRCRSPYGWTNESYPVDTGDWPVTGVTWDDANAYAGFAGKRLPTEEEWEFAAGRGEGNRYPWGDNWLPERANVNSATLVRVASYGAHFALYDMVGNAQEWTAGEWKQYPEKMSYIRTRERADRLRVIRGGGYGDSQAESTVTYRNALRIREDEAEENHYEQTGFRCVREKVE